MPNRRHDSWGQESEHYRGEAEGEDLLAMELAELARDLQDQSPQDLLGAIVRAAVQLIPGVEDGSISILLGRKTVTSQVPTSDLPSRVDAIQMEENEGPCLSAAFNHRTVRIPDMQNEQRWPRFSRRAAAETGVRGMLAFQLFVEDENLGALNLYAKEPHVFDDDSEHIGLLVAAHAAVAFAESRRTVQLNEAIMTRDVIGQAKGILMERHKITSQQAFLLLTTASNRTNTRLTEIAEQLVTSGEMRINPSRG